MGCSALLQEAPSLLLPPLRNRRRSARTARRAGWTVSNPRSTRHLCNALQMGQAWHAGGRGYATQSSCAEKVGCADGMRLCIARAGDMLLRFVALRGSVHPPAGLALAAASEHGITQCGHIMLLACPQHDGPRTLAQETAAAPAPGRWWCQVRRGGRQGGGAVRPAAGPPAGSPPAEPGRGGGRIAGSGRHASLVCHISSAGLESAGMGTRCLPSVQTQLLAHLDALQPGQEGLHVHRVPGQHAMLKVHHPQVGHLHACMGRTSGLRR